MDCSLNQLIILILNVFLVIEAHVYDKTIRLISTREPIINETMYNIYPNLWQLDMSNQTAYEFPANGPFLVQLRLARFICNYCSIGSIYRESLSKVPYLFLLELRNNNLTYIHPDAFEHNPLLESLLLSNNLITVFNPEATLRHFPQLVAFDLSFNVHFDLNKVQFFLKSLITFICQNCATTSLTASTMAKMPRLYNLTLPNNQLERIEENAFAALDRLKAVNVNGNLQLERLKIYSKTLWNLNAQNCSLEGTLDTSDIPQLEEINVRGNHLTHINEHGFFPSVKSVLLDDNEIQKIPAKLLMLPWIHRRTICLDRNPLQPCECAEEATERYKGRRMRNGCLNDDSNSTNFETFLPYKSGLALYKDYMHKIDDNATKVDLSNKNIIVIEKSYLNGFESVLELVFDNNVGFDFKSHEPFLESLSISRLSIKNCSITEIELATFSKLPNLQSIDLEGNHFQTLTNRLVFKNNKELRQLNFSRNNITLLHKNVFRNLDRLQTLHLSGNKHLANSPGVPFVDNYALEELHCRRCGFTQLDDVTLLSLPNLIKLDLSYNGIRTIDSNAFQLNKKLQHVDLRGNDLLSFEPAALKLPSSHLSSFCLDGTTKIISKFNESQVSTNTIDRMIRLQKDCGDGVMFRELSSIYSARVKQTESISASSDENVVSKSQNVTTSESGTVRSHLPFVICIISLVVLY